MCKSQIDTSNIKEIKREGVKTAALNIAIPLDKGAAKNVYQYGVLYAFLPTMQNPRLPFLVHGDFILVPSRDSLMGNREWNRDFSYNFQHNSEFENIKTSILVSLADKHIGAIKEGYYCFPRVCVIANEETFDLTDGGANFNPNTYFATKEFSAYIRSLPAVMSYFKFLVWKDSFSVDYTHQFTHLFANKPISWFIKFYKYLSSKNVSLLQERGNNRRHRIQWAPTALIMADKTLASTGYYLEEKDRKFEKYILPEVCPLIPMEIASLVEKEAGLYQWMSMNLRLKQFDHIEYCSILARGKLAKCNLPIESKIMISNYIFQVYLGYFKTNKVIPDEWKIPFQGKSNTSFPWYSNGREVPREKVVRPYIYSKHLQLLYGLKAEGDTFEDEEYAEIVKDTVQSFVLPKLYFSSAEACDFVFNYLIGHSGLPPPVVSESNIATPLFPWLDIQKKPENYMEIVVTLLDWIKYWSTMYQFQEFSDCNWLPCSNGVYTRPKYVFIFDKGFYRK